MPGLGYGSLELTLGLSRLSGFPLVESGCKVEFSGSDGTDVGNDPFLLVNPMSSVEGRLSI